MSIEVVRGAEAESILADERFGTEWTSLRAGCQWASAFQSVEFTTAWYREYRTVFEPFVVVGRDAGHELTGLIPLAIERASGKLLPAGAHQAEYQGWICQPAAAQSFPSAAFETIRKQSPSTELTFRYLPAGTPLEWCEAGEMARRCLLKAFRRPVMVLGDGQEARQSLQKSGNKSRLRQLKKIGAVEFKRVNDPAEFESILNQAAVCHDCRQLAIHGVAPFVEDDLKRAFHLAMMNSPGLLHVTVLKVGDQIASFHLNVTRGRELQLFLIAHDPRFSRFSPGKLHTLFLARMLQEEGFEQIDLTPGGDGYKERFANGHDVIQRLSVYPTAAHRAKGVVLHRIEDAARDLLGRAGLTPADLRCAWSECSAKRVLDLTTSGVARCGRWLQPSRELQVYACQITHTEPRNDDIGRDNLMHLLAYRPAGGEPSRRAFLADALRRFEDGHHVYTRLDQGRLQVLGWLVEEPSGRWATENLPGIELPEDSATISDFRSSADIAAEAVLHTMMHDAAQAGARQLYAVVPASGGQSRILESLGFVLQGSVSGWTMVGRSQIRSQSLKQSCRAAGPAGPAQNRPTLPMVQFQSSDAPKGEPRRKTG